jgi:hypothetical protein
MTLIKLTTILFGILIFSCSTTNGQTSLATVKNPTSVISDKEQIKKLIRQALHWAHTDKVIPLLPVQPDSKDSLVIGLDLVKHKQNLNTLLKTNLFSSEFINNYNQIILTLDKGIKNGKYEPWLMGDLPPFVFGDQGEVDPWTMSEDYPYDIANPFALIEIDIINLNQDKGLIKWRWGKLDKNTDPSWKTFSRKFKVAKENNTWKIAYLEGFDLKKITE